MQMKKTNQIPLPPKGFRNRIAEIVGCSTKTVTLALRSDIHGYKCDKVRETYHNLYVKPYLRQKP